MAASLAPVSDETKKLPLSIPAWLAGRLATAQIRRIVTAEASPEEIRARLERFSKWTTLLPRGTQINSTTLGTVPGEWLRHRSSSDAGPVLIYLHGGAYEIGSARVYRNLTSRLARATRGRVFAADYRLAPEHPYPAAVEDAVAVYQVLLESGIEAQRIFLAGDSAGGGLALAAAIGIRELELPRAAGLVLLSGWLDLTLSGDSITERAARDRMLDAQTLRAAAERYAGENLRQSMASPLFADLTQLPPMLLQVGTEEILHDDSVRLAEAAEDAGVEVELQIGEELWHSWQALAGTVPEANQAVARIARFISDHCGHPHQDTATGE